MKYLREYLIYNVLLGVFTNDGLVNYVIISKNINYRLWLVDILIHCLLNNVIMF